MKRRKKPPTTMQLFDAMCKQMWGSYWGIEPYRSQTRQLVLPRVKAKPTK